MIRTLLKLAFWAVIVIVFYNYFWGNAAEKAQSSRIFQGVGQIFGEVKSLVVSEKGKFDAGKYDAALDKMGNVIVQLKSHGQDTKNKSLVQQSVQLEERRQHLEHQLNQVQNGSAADKLQQAANLAREMERLNDDLQNLVEKASPGASKR